MNAVALHSTILKYCTQTGLHYAMCRECGAAGDTAITISHKEGCSVMELLEITNRTAGNFLIGVENLVSDALLKKALACLSPEILSELLSLSECLLMERAGAKEALLEWSKAKVPLLDRWKEVRREDAMAFIRDVCLLGRLNLTEHVSGVLHRGIIQRYRIGPLMHLPL